MHSPTQTPLRTAEIIGPYSTWPARSPGLKRTAKVTAAMTAAAVAVHCGLLPLIG